MIRIVFTLGLLIQLHFLCEHCNAQSLVPNGDFELHIGCPTDGNQLSIADYWISASEGTPDYLHSCGSGGYATPENVGGYQEPHSGAAYAAIFLYQEPSVREYIETPLTSPLVAGSIYYFQMYVNLTDASAYTVRNLGVYFSDTLYVEQDIFPLSVTPQIVNTNPNYPDTANWYLVSGEYIAHGGESYIIIGNFDDDSNTPHPSVNPTVSNSAVVLVDDVSLSFTTDIHNAENPHFQIGPVPFNNELMVTVSTPDESELLLFDLAARVVLRKRFAASARMATENLPVGTYIYLIDLPDGRSKRGRLVKEY